MIRGTCADQPGASDRRGGTLAVQSVMCRRCRSNPAPGVRSKPAAASPPAPPAPCASGRHRLLGESAAARTPHVYASESREAVCCCDALPSRSTTDRRLRARRIGSPRRCRLRTSRRCPPTPRSPADGPRRGSAVAAGDRCRRLPDRDILGRRAQPAERVRHMQVSLPPAERSRVRRGPRLRRTRRPRPSCRRYSPRGALRAASQRACRRVAPMDHAAGGSRRRRPPPQFGGDGAVLVPRAGAGWRPATCRRGLACRSSRPARRAGLVLRKYADAQRLAATSRGTWGAERAFAPRSSVLRRRASSGRWAYSAVMRRTWRRAARAPRQRCSRRVAAGA